MIRPIASRYSPSIRHSALNAVNLKFLERRLCQRVHSAVCTRPAANRTRLAGHEKALLGPGRLSWPEHTVG